MKVAATPRAVGLTGEPGRAREFTGGWIGAGVMGTLAALLAPGLLLFLGAEGAAFLLQPSAATLLARDWHPSEAIFGLAPLVAGSLATAMLALLLTLPPCLVLALHLRFLAGAREREWLETTLGLLGGMPSVVFGLFGTFWLVPHLGANLLSGALVLAMMIAPTLALLSLGVLRQVPEDLLRDGARLGLSREQTILRLALVRARPGILAAGALALARGLGEALAVEMVCGNVPDLPTSLLSPVRTLTTTLVQEFEYAQQAHAQALHLVALMVVLLTLAASALGQKLLAARSAS